MKIWKVYDNDNDDNDDGQLTDKFWSEKVTWAFGSGELKIGESINCVIFQEYKTHQHNIKN